MRAIAILPAVVEVVLVVKHGIVTRIVMVICGRLSANNPKSLRALKLWPRDAGSTGKYRPRLGPVSG